MLSSFFRNVQNLSIDIVLGAVILLRFFSSQLGVEIPPLTYLLLGASVWLVYTVDHLKDSRQAAASSRARYLFHSTYEKQLKVIAIIIVLGCAVAVFWLPKDLLIAGGVICLLSSVYLLIHRFLARRGLKEVYIALIYSSGILVTPFTILQSIQWEVFWLLFLLALSNLVLFSFFEKNEDQADGFSSMATALSSRSVEFVILLCISLGITAVLLNVFTPITAFFLLAFSVYAGLFANQQWAADSSRYRMLGDGVFFLPVLF